MGETSCCTDARGRGGRGSRGEKAGGGVCRGRCMSWAAVAIYESQVTKNGELIETEAPVRRRDLMITRLFVFFSLLNPLIGTSIDMARRMKTPNKLDNQPGGHGARPPAAAPGGVEGRRMRCFQIELPLKKELRTQKRSNDSTRESKQANSSDRRSMHIPCFGWFSFN